MIPKLIHQIWFQGCNNIPNKFINYIETIKNNHLDWKYKCWNEEELRQECSNYSSSCVKLFDKFKHMHQKIDLGKYVLLYNYGGAAIDIDCISLKSLNELPGLETKNLILSRTALNYIESYIASRLLTTYNNGTILASPKNIYIKYLIDEIIRRQDCTTRIKINCINQTTGPIQFTKILSKFKNDKSILVLPNKYLEPCISKNIYCKIDDKMSFINHVHEMSWIDTKVHILATMYFFIKRYFIVVLLVAIIILFILSKAT